MNLLNTEYDWDKSSLYQSEPVIWVASFIGNDMVREMKNGKASVPSGVIAEMIKAAGEISIKKLS